MASYRRRGSRPRRPTYAESRHPQWVHEFKGYLRLTNVLGLQILEGQIPRPEIDACEHAPQLQRTFTASSEHYTSTLLMDEHASDEDEDEIDELVDKLDRAFLDQTITGPDLQVLPTSPSAGDGGGGAAQSEAKADAGAALPAVGADAVQPLQTVELLLQDGGDALLHHLRRRGGKGGPNADPGRCQLRQILESESGEGHQARQQDQQAADNREDRSAQKRLGERPHRDDSDWPEC